MNKRKDKNIQDYSVIIILLLAVFLAVWAFFSGAEYTCLKIGGTLEQGMVCRDPNTLQAAQPFSYEAPNTPRFNWSSINQTKVEKV